MKSNITLTINELIEALVSVSGLTIAELGEDGESEVTIAKDSEGITVFDEDENGAEPKQRYRLVIYFDEYPEEGMNPIGQPIES